MPEVAGQSQAQSVMAAAAGTRSAIVRDTHMERLALVIEDLRKRGNACPRKNTTLTRTIQSLSKQRANQPFSEVSLKKLLTALRHRPAARSPRRRRPGHAPR